MASRRRERISTPDVLEMIMTTDSDIEPDTSDESDVEDLPNDAGPPTVTTDETMDTHDYTEWSENLDSYPLLPPFIGNPGLNLPDNTRTPLDFFRLFLTLDLIQLIKREANRYATAEIARVGEAALPNSIYRRWKPVIVNELRGFFAILIHISLVKKPRLCDYWSTTPILTAPFAAKIMSRDRFLHIFSFLHLSDNNIYIPHGQPGHYPLPKTEPVYNHLRQRFKELYIPTKNISIDEAICPFRGRLRFIVYMKDKPHKWGIKFYELCESNSGYVWDFEIYAAVPDLSNRPIDVCQRLMGPLLNKGYVLFTDNYYTCPQLSFELAAEDTMSVGTVRANRVGRPGIW